MLNRLIAISALALFLGGCKSAMNLPAGAPATVKPKVLKERILAAENTFESLRISGSGNFSKGNSSQGFRLEVRLLHDSLGWVDVADPILGIKVARALITPDSVAFVNRLGREYFTGEAQKLQEEFGLEFGFAELQNILAANLIFEPGEAFDLYYKPGLYLLSDFNADDEEAAARTFGQEKFRQIFIDPQLMRPTLQVQNEPVNGRRYSVKYSELQVRENGLTFPEVIEIEYLADGELAKLTITIRSIDKDDPQLNFPFNIPSGYAKMR